VKVLLVEAHSRQQFVVLVTVASMTKKRVTGDED
jgi:hypothetical protein